jgi:large subunit ribosomal protein L25
MSHSELQVEKRLIIGNKVRKLRRDNIIPSVIYSNKFTPTNIQVKIGEFIKVYKVAGKTHVIDITLDGKLIPTIVHDLDIDPITQQVRHVDFLAVDLNEKVDASVPVELIGEARGVKENALVLVQNIKTIEVSALPDNIPDVIEVQISDLLELGDNVTISDLHKSEILEEENTVIATLVTQSQEEEVVSEVITTDVSGKTDITNDK